MHRLPVELVLGDYVVQAGDSCLATSFQEASKRHKRNPDQVAALFDIQIVASTHIFVEHLELKRPVRDEISVDQVDRHCEVLRLVVPGRVAAGFDHVGLDEHSLLFVGESWLHINVDVWWLPRVQRILQSHAIVDFEVHCNLLSGLVLLDLIEHSIGYWRSQVHGAAVLIHVLGQLSEQDDVVYVACLEAVRYEIDVKRLNLLNQLNLRPWVLVLDVDISEAVDEIVYDFGLDVHFPFK